MLPTWIVIGGVTLLVAFGTFLFRPRDISWAKRLDRPRWLFFEPAIPLIWTVIFISGAASATLTWNADPGSLKTWFLMGWFLVIELLTVAYIPATLRSRSLAVGTLLGGTGFVLAIALFPTLWPISLNAALLLIPYILWSPIGTYTTRRMIDLNPGAI